MNCLSFKKKLGFVSLFALSALLTPSSLMAMSSQENPETSANSVNGLTQGMSDLGFNQSSFPPMNSSVNRRDGSNPFPMGMPPFNSMGSSFPMYSGDSPSSYSNGSHDSQPLSMSMHPFNGDANPFLGSSSMMNPTSSFPTANRPGVGGSSSPNKTATLSASSVTPSSTTTMTTTPKPYVPTKLLCPSLEEVNKLILKAKSEVFTEEVGKAQDAIIKLAINGSYVTYLTPRRIGFLDWKKATPLEDHIYNNDESSAYAIRWNLPVTLFPKLPEVVQKRAEEGNPLAQATLGMMCFVGYGGIEKNPQKAIEYYTKSGISWAKAQLTSIYSAGKEVPQDKAMAFKFFKEAANEGHLVSQAQYGRVLKHGHIWAPKNEKEAIDYFTKAALRGNDIAQFELGVAYEPGIGSDPKKAVEWYTRSALQGNRFACYNLGVHLLNGTGIEKNFMAAFGYQKIGQKKEAEGTFLASHVSPIPVSTVFQKPWKETLEEMIMTLTGWVMHHRQEIEEEKKHGDLAAPNYIKLHQKALTVEEEALQVAGDLLKHYKLGFTLVPGLQFSEEILKDFPKQAAPQQVVRCDIDGILCYSFGTYNIENQNKLLAYRGQVKEKFKSADKALKKLAKVFCNESGDNAAQATLRKRRQDPENKEDCQTLAQTIKRLHDPLEQNEKEQEDLAKIRNRFQALPHSMGQENQDEFFKQLQ